jgi:hypothetical protein
MEVNVLYLYYKEYISLRSRLHYFKFKLARQHSLQLYRKMEDRMTHS